MNQRFKALLGAHPKIVIALLIALINFAVGFAAYSWLAYSKERMHDEAARDARNIGRILELSITASLRSVDLAMSSMASEIGRCPVLGSPQCKALTDVVRDHSRDLVESQAFFIADTEGLVQFGLSNLMTMPMPVSYPSVKDRDYFIQVKNQPIDVMILSKPHLGKVSGRWVLNLARPILNEQKNLLGVLIASIDLVSLQKPLLAVDLGAHGAVSLRDGEMGVILRVPEPKGIGTNIGAKNISPQLAAMLEKKLSSGSYLGVTPLDGIERTVAFTRSSAYPFYVNVGLSAEDYLEPWRRERNLSVWGCLAFLLLTGVAGWGLWQIYHQKLLEIIQRQAMESALTASEETFKTLVNGTSLGIVLVAPDGRIAYHNPAFTQILGYTEADLPDIDSWWQQAYPNPIYRQTVQEVWATEVMAPGAAKQFSKTFVVRAKNGADLDILFTVAALPDAHFIVTFNDVTEANRKAQIHSSILDTAIDGFWLVGGDGRLLEVNAAACQMLGYRPDEMQQLFVHEIDASATREKVKARTDEVISQGHGRIRTRHRCKNGHQIDVELSVIYLPKHNLFCTFVRDITARKKTEDDLRLAASVFANSQEGIMVTDAESRIIDVNRSFSRLTGYAKEDVLGKNPRFLKSGKHDSAFYAEMWAAINQHGAWQGEVWNRKKSGEVVAELLSIDRVTDPKGVVQHYVAVFSDISLMKTHEAELYRIAHFDLLTGVPNRRLLTDRLDQAVARARRSKTLLAVCYLDLDGFKPVNDQFGHAAGDQVLIDLVSHLQAHVRGDDTIARLGGDEFILLLNDIVDKPECTAVLDRILAAVATPSIINGEQVSVSASIGVAIFPDDDTDPDTLLRHADHAMYQAKERGRSRYQFFEPVI